MLDALPNGFVDASAGLARMASLSDGWPTEALWINAVRQRDLRRVVFGRDIVPDLGQAVAASCAIPALFTPVRIGGEPYVDGGVHSPTNAALLRGCGLDLAVIISPMSGPAGSPLNVYAASRRHAARLLRREVRALEAAGVRTVVFTPGPDEQEVMGDDMLSRHRLDEVIQQSFLAAGAHSARPEIAELIRTAAAAGRR